jgi:16S rRNA (uracil1498-N3)-methyltransferase
MHRFFVDKNNIKLSSIDIIGEDVKHIKSVLRLNVGDVVVVCDNDRTDYTAKIISIDKNIVQCEILSKEASKSEPPIDIILYQGLPKASKMDLIIQKATELGVKKIVPVITERTVVKIQDRKKENNKLERWNRIAEEAAKQSKRGIIPQVNNILDFDEMIAILKEKQAVIVPYENEENTGIKDVLKNCSCKEIHILIGPEGGFEETEIQSLINIKCNIVTLGPRILRTETAGLVTSAVVLYELGDLGVV